MDTKRGPITPRESFPYKGSILLGPTAKAFCKADFRYSDPRGYLISSIFPLPLSRGKRGSPGAFQRATPFKLSEVSPVRPEPGTAEESPPMRNEEERPEPIRVIEIEQKDYLRQGITKRQKKLCTEGQTECYGKRKPNSQRNKKASRSGEHKTKGQKIFSKETKRTGRDGRENRKVIIITRHMTTTKP